MGALCGQSPPPWIGERGAGCSGVSCGAPVAIGCRARWSHLNYSAIGARVTTKIDR